MRKIQNFSILKLDSTRIRDNNYNLTVSYNQAVNNQEIVQIADSQLVRTINRLKDSRYSESYLNELLSKKKSLSKKRNSKENREAILQVINDIQTILYIPELVSISFSNKRHTDKIIKNGFILNGEKYSAFMASSGMIRRNTCLFILDKLYKEIELIFDNGRNPDKEMVEVKFGVYYSLYSSSSLEVTFPRIAVVKDKLMSVVREVDYTEIIGENKIGVDPKIYPREMEIECNSFDGQGLVSPRFAKIWSSDLELDYIPSAFIVRSSYLKGLCVTFDFHKLAKEKDIKQIVDIYENLINIRDVDVIISESQFKLWSSYSSTNDYLDNCEKNDLGWGITRVSPKADKTHAFSSYQFIQSLKVDNEAEICEPTVNWLSSLGNTKENILAYLMGDIEYSDGWFNRLEPSTQAILLENDLLKDTHTLKQIEKSISKKKHDSCMGRLVFQGNYQFMIGDPYAQCIHVFGLDDERLLDEGECYSQFWNERDAGEIALVRSPNVHSSEIDKLSLKKTRETKDWYRYISSGIIFPPYGVSLDMAVLGGADVDGDIVFSTDYKPFVNGKQAGKPLFYEILVPEKRKIENKNSIINKQSLGIGSKVGFLTNYGSTVVTMLSDYKYESEEYRILNNRYHYIRTAQGLELDKQKGLIIPDFPNWWSKAEKTMTVFEKSLVVAKRPYFFRYLYEYMNKRYNSEFMAYDNISRVIYNMGLRELISIENPTTDQKSLIDTYRTKSFFIDNQSIMNRVSHYMEHKIKDMSRERREIGKTFDYRKILSKRNYSLNKNDLDKMQILFKEYKSLKRALREGLQDYTEENYSSLDQIRRYINKRAYATISSNAEDLANMAVCLCYSVLGETSRKFAWECFGQEIVENIKKRKKDNFVRVPIKNKNGSFEYLFSRYGIFLMNID